MLTTNQLQPLRTFAPLRTLRFKRQAQPHWQPAILRLRRTCRAGAVGLSVESVARLPRKTRRIKKQRDKVPSKLPAFLNALLYRFVFVVSSRRPSAAVAGDTRNIGPGWQWSNSSDSKPSTARKFAGRSDRNNSAEVEPASRHGSAAGGSSQFSTIESIRTASGQNHRLCLAMEPNPRQKSAVAICRVLQIAATCRPATHLRAAGR